ncbi:MAG: preprotein translocase subunit SecY [Candidatus Yanofskybacteria bacterium RIFCSPHIGHO2_02_FULL_41_29]|uniref:Protein translocase subunit SecY n=1 Tax=Candidatus Yanofskybacteria bacterium RIFCSPHIGHO2_01_FULL_41_53 TaxID=1802663 RepID=A0A1F8EHN4_9BACT|nr:MAG: preprotein translocase subunit SecY [Candidatus Yanofskybacteria bacterium RIFCSPHIGHO2_01_FULL_41_53]OGN11585.1 MAG: preprotein translocase subunit SecY [Candidatus Yanofskybacteria bacterium RIFCSPHIGHO2_02_FULL_41_29]OGN18840.1 MAG: preprotein translocase subunit SecY [Candidatus Yanofskybacteria bacterium RIFCSPHIGHO2_12_FULL_41_9]OGN22821.1 MAG: preprotein translocase subunit SecY [Candidatus Yanofskybacteria bacterium RIFCSPLOWO2_01_FULL_41_67]OGN30088.1 MAG: preprotein translocas
MNRILQIFKRPELRNKVLFILGLLVVFRVISNIPIPAVDAEQLKNFFQQNQLFGLISAFTGGSLTGLSIGMLGLGPYITGSIIMQLLTMIFPSLEQMYKYEGEAGRMKFNQYSRLLTVPLAALQGFGFLTLLSRQGVIGSLTTIEWIATLVTITAGSIVLMWLGELITEKNLGNGVSLLILAGIVAGFPTSVRQAFFSYTPNQLITYGIFVAVALAVIVGVVYISEAQRNIPINYARRIRGSKVFGGVSTYLPMRVNNAGVIPIIFALSILLFPGMVANFLSAYNIPGISQVAVKINDFLQSNLWYSTLYFFLVVLFTYFYTAITFDPKSISENIQKNGGYIPGIRPGPMTAQFLNHLLTRVTLVGALFLGTIAILPNIVQGFTGITAFTVGGTSILIVVSVALEVMKQVDAQLSMYEY